MKFSNKGITTSRNNHEKSHIAVGFCWQIILVHAISAYLVQGTQNQTNIPKSDFVCSTKLNLPQTHQYEDVNKTDISCSQTGI